VQHKTSKAQRKILK